MCVALPPLIEVACTVLSSCSELFQSSGYTIYIYYKEHFFLEKYNLARKIEMNPYHGNY